MIRYFTWEELTHTDTGLPNTPTDINVIANLISLARMLDVLRIYYDGPIRVNSGYRSKEVNAAVGGVATSHHLFGFAADITSSNIASLKDAVLANKHWFDQVILYPNFIHVSIAPLMRHQVINKDKES
jgi:zinc D-Ala-D-Ala carboxypeptidase